MSTIRRVIIGAAFVFTGSTIAAQAWAATEANDSSATSQGKSEYTVRARPNDHEQVTITGWIADVRAFYAERGIELSEWVAEGASNNPPPMPPPPESDTISKLMGSIAPVNSIDLVTFHIVIGKWDRVTRYQRKAIDADQSLAAGPWKLVCDGAYYGHNTRTTLNPDSCDFLN